MSDVDRYQYGYDPNSNRLYKANVVGTPVVSGGLDEYYSYDNLNRLTVMQRGVLNGTSTGISGTPSREMDYTLDPTGNWSAYLTKTNGTTDLNQTRTANKVNEITAIGGTPAWATPPVYDAAGNMTSFPQPASPASNFIATYDAWNRMTSINTSGGSVATYQYDGRGRRIVKNTAATGETRHFYYTSSWQDIEERTGTSTTMDKQYVWGVRYIDELVCRDDATPQRLYAMQDANFNLTSIANASGGVVERYRFDPYGSRTIMNASWGTITASTCNLSIGHQGLIQDVESGLVYNRVRYLDTAFACWLSRDVAYLDSINLYESTLSNPVNYLDPSGMKSPQGPQKPKCSPDAIAGGLNSPFPRGALLPYSNDGPNSELARAFGNLSAAQNKELSRGCVGIAKVCQGTAGDNQPWPELEPNTTCFLDRGNAESSKCPNCGPKFVFAVQGQWATTAPTPQSDGSVDPASFDHGKFNQAGNFNYISVLPNGGYAWANYGSASGSPGAVGVLSLIPWAACFPQHEGTMWCVTCLTNTNTGQSQGPSQGPPQQHH
jgi:RHS repeat-associated protein